MANENDTNGLLGALSRIPGMKKVMESGVGGIYEAKEEKFSPRGENAAFGDMPGKHEMPPKKVKDKIAGSTDQDDEENPVQDTPKAESRQQRDQRIRDRSVKESKLFVAGLPMSDFRRMAGMELNEESYTAPPVVAGTSRHGKSGEVPTGGVNKSNKMKGGLPGLEGDSVQKIEPEEGPEGEDHVGDATETTFDDAIAMLKKEGYDLDSIWGDFLAERGLTAELFGQLIDEAAATDDEDEINTLLAVEDIFKQYVVQEGGFLDKIMGRNPQTQQVGVSNPRVAAAVDTAADAINTHGADKVAAFNKMGLNIHDPVHHEAFAARMASKVPQPQGLAHRKAAVMGGGGQGPMESIQEGKPALGSGARFAALKNKIAKKGGVKNPAAVAAAVGRKKYGEKKMEKLSLKGKRDAKK